MYLIYISNTNKQNPYSQKAQFFALLESKHRLIQAIVAQHLGLRSANACQVAPLRDWLHGSYNVCVKILEEDLVAKDYEQ
ncbi:hypothetical protein TSTA_023110 [Talaromyces stipitatus ATCC 10500]|uniref:Uncharacterized protein n=1 Tax=Talaromyces stipitatus (strain ATCC 10500 / CBS 375.48 / QM 6759 / NRRL 1006) TaxID=441959 RepID=B8MEX4_TALSN|nr:uncharacterized protein TSTA_023110 [Talaromyces stipitatus ATCC 10500]EED17257.1 hypothetical protein TSTA_023110 [Talaromyces stipitatus ATCC 10500]